MAVHPRLERPLVAAPGLAQVRRDFGLTYVSNAFVAFVFTATGPLAIILAVGTGGGLSPAELASWVFGVFFFNGVVSAWLTWRYRMPLGMAWTIPGTVLIGPALQHLSFREVIGAFYVTAVLIFLLGLSGWVKRLMQALPMPIVMGMVAGVFLKFGLDIVRAVHGDVAVAGPMVLAFFVLSASPRWSRRLPPVVGALVLGVIAIALTGRAAGASLGEWAFARPVLQAPAWSLGALLELVIPLAITVLVVQNGQGVAVLRAAGHEPPVNTVAVASGVGAFFCAMVGAVSTCLTGPSNALMTSSGQRERQYTAVLAYSMMMIVFGLMAPTFTGLMLAAPKEFIMALGGVAMLRVLQSAFVVSFSSRFTLGALVTFLVTVADKSLLNIGAAFWGLVAGFAVSWLLERADFRALADAAANEKDTP